MLGIAELEQNIFYVVAGNFSVTLLTPTAGKFSLWIVVVNTFKQNKALAEVKKVMDIPEAKFLTGATVLSPKKGTLLIADSLLGSVF